MSKFLEGLGGLSFLPEKVRYSLLVSSDCEKKARNKLHAFTALALNFFANTDLKGLNLTEEQTKYLQDFLNLRLNESANLQFRFFHSIVNHLPFLTLYYKFKPELSYNLFFAFEGQWLPNEEKPYGFSFGVFKLLKDKFNPLFVLNFFLVEPEEMDETAVGKIDFEGKSYAVLGEKIDGKIFF